MPNPRKPKNAPAPWYMVRYEGEPGAEGHWAGWHIKEAESGLTDVAYVDDVDYGPEAAKAHARLIAAAPDMLAAIKSLLKLQPEERSSIEVEIDLEAVVAKAEGGTDAPPP